MIDFVTKCFLMNIEQVRLVRSAHLLEFVRMLADCGGSGAAAPDSGFRGGSLRRLEVFSRSWHKLPMEVYGFSAAHQPFDQMIVRVMELQNNAILPFFNNVKFTPNMMDNVISTMIQNEDSYAISQVAVVTNAITSDDEVDANDRLFEEDDIEEDDQESFDNFQKLSRVSTRYHSSGTVYPQVFPSHQADL
ncbi:hypothetical protein LXL04_006571 [Taraxacum kok-saghyz]